jgi:hypothetical protein
MFWACFSYDKKGPCHCWCKETAQERAKSIEYIQALNDEIEPIKKAEWELQTGVRRLRIDRQQPGQRPVWKWIKANGKLSRGKGGGIDWYRYQINILIPKLFPFAKECQIDRPNTVVQEDKAPAHDHYIQRYMYKIHDVEQMLWCGNSPDLNAIEAAWPWMKRKTTCKGALKNRQQAVKAWEDAWKELPQEKIQAWIERIPVHVAKIIELEGGNEYREGRGERIVSREELGE